MKCANHPTKDATLLCEACDKPLCPDCAVEVTGRPWCAPCLERVVADGQTYRHQSPTRRRRLVAGLLSLVPGAGHMYLGLIGKGFALMGILIAAVFFVILYSDATGLYWIAAYLVPTLSVLLLSYAVFDALAIAEGSPEADKPVDTQDAAMRAIWERLLMDQRTGGWVLLLAGIVGLLNLFEATLGGVLRTYLGIGFPLAALVIPLVLLFAGIHLLRKGR